MMYHQYRPGYVEVISMMWTDIDVYPDKRQASGQILHGQDEWFTCDVTAAGAVSYTHLDVYKRQVQRHSLHKGRRPPSGQQRWRCPQRCSLPGYFGNPRQT